MQIKTRHHLLRSANGHLGIVCLSWYGMTPTSSTRPLTAGVQTPYKYVTKRALMSNAQLDMLPET